MRYEPLSSEEIKRQQKEKYERDMKRIVWILMPITIDFFLLLVIARFWLSNLRDLRRPLLS